MATRDIVHVMLLAATCGCTNRLIDLSAGQDLVQGSEDEETDEGPEFLGGDPDSPDAGDADDAPDDDTPAAVDADVPDDGPAAAVDADAPGADVPGDDDAVSESSADWLAVSAGGDRTCAIAPDGTLWCWGESTQGSSPEYQASSTPTMLAMPSVNLSAVVLSSAHSCVISDAGILSCWGQGYLGLGDTYERALPTALEGAWQQVALGWQSTCGVQMDDTLWCWGENDYGQLGSEGTAITWPAQVGDAADWLQVTVGNNHSCGIRAPGTLWCWGANYNAQLGLGGSDYEEHPTPEQVDLSSDWQTVVTCPTCNRTCAVRGAGDLYCWGDPHEGALATSGDSSLPNLVVEPGPWLSVALGTAFTCALKAPGELFCWGSNAKGQTAGEAALQTVPVQRSSGSSWSAIALGDSHGCAIENGLDEQQLFCFGANSQGQLGIGVTGDKEAPAQVVDGGSALNVAAGLTHTCAHDSTGSLWCWGAGDYLGQGTDAMSTQVPVLTSNTGYGWSEVDAGFSYSCALTAIGKLNCWGANGEQVRDYTPTQIGSAEWRSVAVGWLHQCVIGKNSGELWCWGDNSFGQTGTGADPITIPFVAAPTQVDPGGEPWDGVFAGPYGTCGLRAGGLWCWGTNAYSDAPLAGTSVYSEVPTRIDSTGPSDWLTAGPGYDHTCALRGAGELWCWGLNVYGEFGESGNTQSWGAAKRIGTRDDWTKVVADYRWSCALRADTSLWCWGIADGAKLGQGSAMPDIVPATAVAGAWIDVSVGNGYVCGIQQDLSMWCWGSNSSGQLGDGTAWSEELEIVIR